MLLLSTQSDDLYLKMQCSLCNQPATKRCAIRCGYLACDKCHAAHSCTKWTPDKILQFYSTGEMIGRGGFGRVYGNDAMDPNIAIKFSRSKLACADFEVEYKLASRIHQRQRELGFADENYELIRVYADVPAVTLPDSPEDSHCAFVMQRVHQPRLRFGSDNRLSYQFYLGSDVSVTSPGRGNYIGVDDIRTLIGEEKMKDFAYSAGRFLAFLHYGAKVDASDMEYIIGYVKGEERLKVYALDFDRVKPINAYGSAAVGELEWSISSEPYFPYPTDELLYPRFKSGYLQVANEMGMVDFAEMVIQRYEESAV